ncbi:MAG: DUF4153 domain-containing protein [bacterium]
MERPQQHSHHSFLQVVLYFLLPGILQGVALWYLFERGFNKQTYSITIQSISMFFLVAPTAYFLTTQQRFRITPLIFSVILGTLTASLYYLAQSLYGVGYEGNEHIIATSYLANILICYIAVPFFRTVIERGQAPNHYPSLFEFAWNLPVILAASTIFTTALWIVLWLWIALFNVIGIKIFEEIFTEPVIAWSMTSAAGAIAIAIIRDREGIILALRGILFAMLRLLSPIVLLATGLFVLTFPFQGLGEFAANGWSLAGMMIWAITLAVIFTNAVIGEEGRPENMILRWSVRLQSLLLPILAAIAIYALWLRLSEYGLTVARIDAVIITLFASGYALAYFISALLPQAYGLLRQLNILLAGGLFVTAILIQTPLLNPYKITANDQYARISDGRLTPETIDFAYYRFQLGKEGEKLLNWIEETDTLPEHALLKAEVENIRNAESKWAYHQGPKKDSTLLMSKKIKTGKITVIPQTAIIPDAVLERIAKDYRFRQNECGNEQKPQCFILQQPLGKTPTYIALNQQYNNNAYNVLTYYAEGEEWRSLNSSLITFEDMEEMNRFQSDIRSGNITEVPITIRTIQIGDKSLFWNITPQNREILTTRQEEE